MIVFSEWLKVQRQEKEYSQQQLADWLSERLPKGSRIGKNIVSNWERALSEPNLEQFLQICSFASVHDFYADFLQKPQMYRLNKQGWDLLDKFAELLEGNSQYALAPKVAERLIRVYNQPVSAGTGNFLDSDDYELMDAGDIAPPGTDFGVYISGDSMEKLFMDGQIVWVRQQNTLNSGEIGIVYHEHQGYIKKLHIDEDGVWLVSCNKAYSPIPVPQPEELRVFGKVLG